MGQQIIPADQPPVIANKVFLKQSLTQLCACCQRPCDWQALKYLLFASLRTSLQTPDKRKCKKKKKKVLLSEGKKQKQKSIIA